MPDSRSDDESPPEHSFGTVPAIIAVVLLQCLVALQALLAYRDHFFTVSQMRRHGVHQGLPFLWHFGMWGDALVISGLAAYAIGRYFHQWRRARSLPLSLVLGFGLAGLFSWVYTLSGMPEAHVQHHHLTPVGVAHLFYMGIALSVFIQLFFLTNSVSAQLLRIASALLTVHVFVGTHMALGILNIIAPQTWYPAQPLRSLLGWSTILVVAFTLLFRSFGIKRVGRSISRTAAVVFAVLMYLINQDPKSSEGYLRFLDYLCGFITFTFFFKQLSARWHHGQHSMSLALILLFGSVYYLSRLSVWQELKISKLVFQLNRIPDDLQLKDRFRITLYVTVFMALYVVLGWAADYILLAALFMFVIACIDINTRREINLRARQYFDAPQYALSPHEQDYEAMRDRRSVIEWFLFKLPHLWKERARAAGCGVAVGLGAYGCLNQADWANRFAYFTLMGTLILNEVVTWWWRIRRDRGLKIISF